MEKHTNIQNQWMTLGGLLIPLIAAIAAGGGFSEQHNIVYGVFNSVILALICVKSFSLYKETNDKRACIVAGGFLSWFFVEMAHSISSFDQSLSYYYSNFSAVPAAISIIVTLFYSDAPVTKNPKIFLMKILTINSLFIFVAILSGLLTSVEQRYLLNYIIPESTIVTNCMLLGSLLYIDFRRNLKLTPLSKFTVGLILYAIAWIYFPTENYTTSTYRNLGHLMDLWGHILVFGGLTEILIKPKIFSIRYKLVLFTGINLIVFFALLVSSFIELPEYFQYIFVITLLLFIISEYFISTNIIIPVNNIVEGIEKNVPGEKPVKIPIISNDEAGILTEEFNKNAELNWEYVQEINQRIKREKLLKEVTDTIRNSLDISEVLYTICKKVAEVYDVERSSIVEFPEPNNYEKWIFQQLYKKREDIIDPVDIDMEPRVGNYNGKVVVKEGHNLVIDNVEESDTPDYFKKAYSELMGVKSILSVPVRRGDERWGLVFLCKYDEYRHWEKEEVELLENIADQIFLAINQARLYEKQKQIAEREILLRDTIAKIRSTLDLNKIKQFFVKIIGEFFNADRVVLSLFDKKSGHFLPADKNSEYLSDPSQISFVGYDWARDEIIPFIKPLEEGKEVVFSDLDDYLFKNKLENSALHELFLETNIGSSYNIPIFYTNQLKGYFCIDFNEKNIELDKESFILLKTLSDQAGVAIHQSELYGNEKQRAFKESILRDLISEIKITRNLNEAYSKLLQKLSQVFNLERVLFLETSTANPNDLFVKYEYTNESLPLNNLIFPQVCVENFLKLVDEMEPLVVDNIQKCGNEHEQETIEFLTQHKINALIAIPLVKLNKEIKIFGFIVLCSENIRIWSDEEVDLIKSISESIVTIIWEITKFIEIEELRNSFISTLTHDFQIPLIGEKTALEYLSKNIKSEALTTKELIAELSNNNLHMTTLLKNSIDIYNYESGVKVLNYSLVKASKILEESISLNKKNADAKYIAIDFHCLDKDLLIKADKQQLVKVFNTVINNAIEKSPMNSKIHVGLYKKDDKVIVYIKDHGAGIPQEIREKIFKRYEMAVALERKIGGGIGLLLAKYIIEAHDGLIWFETQLDKGTVFFISLPIKESK